MMPWGLAPVAESAVMDMFRLDRRAAISLRMAFWGTDLIPTSLLAVSICDIFICGKIRTLYLTI